MISGYPLHYSMVSDREFVFEVDLEGGQKVIIKTFKDLVNVKIENPNLETFGESVGLMGDFETSELLARDGMTTLEDDPIAFGQEWQVLDTESNLFQQTLAEPQYPHKCLLPDPTTKALGRRGRRLGGQTISHETAMEACAHYHHDGDVEMQKNCIYDVIATGDIELAQQQPF